MLQIEPAARLPITDMLGHPWFRLNCPIDEEYRNMIRPIVDSLEYDVDKLVSTNVPVGSDGNYETAFYT